MCKREVRAGSCLCPCVLPKYVCQWHDQHQSVHNREAFSNGQPRIRLHFQRLRYCQCSLLYSGRIFWRNWLKTALVRFWSLVYGCWNFYVCASAFSDWKIHVRSQAKLPDVPVTIRNKCNIFNHRYQSLEGMDLTCHVNGTADDLTSIYTCSEEEKSSSSLNNYKYIFYLGHLLMGVGSSPLYTLGLSVMYTQSFSLP